MVIGYMTQKAGPFWEAEASCSLGLLMCTQSVRAEMYRCDHTAAHTRSHSCVSKHTTGSSSGRPGISLSCKGGEWQGQHFEGGDSPAVEREAEDLAESSGITSYKAIRAALSVF